MKAYTCQFVVGMGTPTISAEPCWNVLPLFLVQNKVAGDKLLDVLGDAFGWEKNAPVFRSTTAEQQVTKKDNPQFIAEPSILDQF
mmetsp:Transcript_11830/g.29007  ORF Transcript_11830/g.29007 Transcript_11830/m.29007 type:complete len:85 (+) Transcript_11830:268-522(+)